MKLAIGLAVLALVALTAAVHDKDVYYKQQKVAQLLSRAHQPTYFKELVEIGNSYDIYANVNAYKNTTRVKEFLFRYKHDGFYDYDHQFNLFHDEHLEQAHLLFDVFYYAKDFETFYKTACWARNRIPAGVFVYAFSVAVMHREDLQGVTVPPPYETYPYFYVSSDVLQKSYQAKMRGYQHYHEICDLVVDEKCVFYANHTNYNAYYNTYAKSYDSLSYFTEDIGLNAFYSYWQLEHPYWLGYEFYGKPSNHIGELFLYTHHQILARYYLERYSNGFDEVKPVFYWDTVEEGYVPHLRYPNGYEMVSRPDYSTYKSDNNFDLHLYEIRITDAIDSGYVFTKSGEKYSLYEEKGINYLGEVIFGYADAVNRPYYGELYNYMLYVSGYLNGNYKQHSGVYPSVLHSIHTLLRDPVFYRIYKRIDNLYYKYIEHKHPYSTEELTFNGVYLKNFEVDKLVTYFDEYDTSLSYGVDVANEEDASKVNIVARHFRLNHEPFKYHFNIESDKQQTVMVRVFLGPKYDKYGHDLDIQERSKYFVEMDRFPYVVNAGKNVFERNSRESTVFVQDYKPFDYYFKDTQSEQYPRTCGFPERLALPRGSKNGVPYTYFVMVTPYTGKETEDKAFYGVPYCGAHFHQEYPDDLPMGYPFNRPIYNEYTFYTPNMYFKDVFIYHKPYYHQMHHVEH